MSKKLSPFGVRLTNKHTDIQQTPRRVASRMEGGVKNQGTQKQKKSRRAA